MKRLLLLLSLVLGFAALGPVAAKAHSMACRRVYVIESGVPVARIVYFDSYGRCFRPYGARRIYYDTYYSSYPYWYRRHHRGYYDDDDYYRSHRRPRVGISFGFAG